MPDLSAYQLAPREALAFLLIAVCAAALAAWVADRLHRRVGQWSLLAFSVAAVVLTAVALLPAGEAALQIALATVFSVSCAFVARSKGRNATLWATGGFLFNLIALVAIAVLPRRPRKQNPGSGPSGQA